MRRLIPYLFLLLAALNLQAQDSTALARYYRSPLAADMPLLLASNFGELRPNHFHAGLDFRVGGAPGAKLFAVADGYVSRISVAAEGYGKAVYINHPNGTTSVYGHLHAFSPEIKKYIENIQYQRQRFAVDESLEPGAIRVKKGEQIGIAGNSGSSFGAHLHFELRSSATQGPMNTLTAGVHKVNDNIAPVIREIIFYHYEEEQGIPVISPFLSSKTSNPQRRVDVPERFFIAIDATDRQNGTNGRFDINRMEVKLDDKLCFAYRIDDFLYEESRYINSLIAYDYLQVNSHPMIKTYVEPGNKISTVYKQLVSNGIMTLPDDQPHRLEINVFDDAQNRSSCSFILQRRASVPLPPAYVSASQPATPMYYNKDNKYEQEGMRLEIPAGSLYRSVFLAIDTATYAPACAHSPLWSIHTNEVPLHSSGANLHLCAYDIPEQVQSKALIALVSKTGGIKAVGGNWNANGVTAKISSFGNYCVVVDTTAPSIRPTFKRGAKLSGRNTLTVKISDKLSGISSYTAFIDGQWALFEYDAKNNVLIYTFDPQRIKKNSKHTLKLSVTDKRMNTAGLETTFSW